VQVSDKYVHVVTSINNADTLITLIVPSIMIIFSNVRISVALSQFHRDRQTILAQERETERTSGDAIAAAAAAAASSHDSSQSRQSRSLRHQTSITRAEHNDLNRLQMKVRLMNSGTRS